MREASAPSSARSTNNLGPEEQRTERVRVRPNDGETACVDCESATTVTEFQEPVSQAEDEQVRLQRSYLFRTLFGDFHKPLLFTTITLPGQQSKQGFLKHFQCLRHFSSTFQVM